MRKYEIAAVVLLVLFAISIICTPLYTMVLSRVYGLREELVSLSLHQRAIVSAQALLRSLVGIAIAVWLGLEARKDGFSVPVWALFGLLFSVLGAILYFVLRGQVSRSTGGDEIGAVEGVSS